MPTLGDRIYKQVIEHKCPECDAEPGSPCVLGQNLIDRLYAPMRYAHLMRLNELHQAEYVKADAQ